MMSRHRPCPDCGHLPIAPPTLTGRCTLCYQLRYTWWTRHGQHHGQAIYGPPIHQIATWARENPSTAYLTDHLGGIA